MKLELQLAKLAELGLELNANITLEDLLFSFDREAYEHPAFDLLLSAFGMEVECGAPGRNVCSRVWNFDTECIYESGNYTDIVKRLCEVVGSPHALTEIADHVNHDVQDGWLQYKLNGTMRHWKLEINDASADVQTLSHVLKDLEHGKHRFFFKENGEALVLFFLDEKTAAALNVLTHDALKPLLA